MFIDDFWEDIGMSKYSRNSIFYISIKICIDDKSLHFLKHSM